MSLDPSVPGPCRLASLEGVPSAYAAARDGIDVMLRDRGLRRTSPETTAESLLRGAHATAVLEGSASSLRRGPRRDRRRDRRRAVRLSTELLALVPVLARSPLQALARLHALAAAAGRRRRSGGPATPRRPAAARRRRRC